MPIRKSVPDPRTAVREAVQSLQGEFGIKEVVQAVVSKFPDNYLLNTTCADQMKNLINEGLIEYAQPPRSGRKSKYKLKISANCFVWRPSDYEEIIETLK